MIWICNCGFQIPYFMSKCNRCKATRETMAMGLFNEKEEKVRDEKEPTAHHIKCEEEYFQALISDKKTFEYRKNDRGYKVDDILQIYEFTKEKGFSGRLIVGEVTYAMHADVGHDGVAYIIMSLRVLSKGNVVWAEHTYNQAQPNPTSRENKDWIEKTLVKAKSPAVRGPS